MHNRLMNLLLLCMILALSGAQPLFARVVSVQKDMVNIRDGAGITSAVVGKAGKDAIFAWLSQTEGWSKICLADGSQGYIRNDLLAGYDELMVTGSSVRIRKSPSQQGTVLGSVKKGDKLVVSDYRDGWYGIQFGQTVAWISGDYVKCGQRVDLSVASAGESGRAGAYSYDSVAVSASAQGEPLSGRIITLDPGHGAYVDGKQLDPGAESASLGIWEKDVNLDITIKLKRLLENMGATVRMTHTGATGLDLSGRAAVANQNGSHIFVSIHANSSENPALNGHSVYFYGPEEDARLGSQRSLRQTLARCVQKSMTLACGRPDLGVKEANFVVLRETNCPSILVESAFLSHGEEELLLAQGMFRQRLAEAIAAGILDYFSAL